MDVSNLVNKSYQVSFPEVSLRVFIKENYFKLFLDDVGILNSILELDYADIMMNKVSLYKGEIAENYVANHLLYNGYSLYYWQSNATSDVDFIIYTKDGNIPIEVRAGDSVKSKSLNVYMEKFQPSYAIRISTRNFGFDEIKKIKLISLYAVFCIKN